MTFRIKDVDLQSSENDHFGPVRTFQQPLPDHRPGDRFYDFCGGDDDRMQALADRAQRSPVFKMLCGDRHLDGNDPGDAGLIEAILLWEYEAGPANESAGTEKMYMLFDQLARNEDVGAADPYLYERRKFLETLKAMLEEEEADLDEATAARDEVQRSRLAQLISTVTADISAYQSLPSIPRAAYVADGDDGEPGSIDATETTTAHSTDKSSALAPAIRPRARPSAEIALSQYLRAKNIEPSLKTDLEV